MEAKLSSSSTSEAASRATSVPRPPMATPDVRGLERRGVVDAVAGHGDDLAVGLERLHDAQFLLRRDAGADAHCRSCARCNCASLSVGQVVAREDVHRAQPVRPGGQWCGAVAG